MTRSLLTLLFALLLGARVACAAAAPAADAGAAPIDWIKSLPGVRFVASDGVSATYLVDAGSDIMQRIQQGLQEHGWNSRLLSGGHVVMASNDHSHLSINLQQNAINGANMTLRMDDGSSAAAPSLPTTSFVASPAEPADFSRGALKGDNGRHTYKLSGDLTIEGSSNQIVLSGSCGKLTVNGDSNHISGNCHYSHIIFNGHDNQLEWSTATNKNPPDVFLNGPNNVLISL